MTAKNFESTLRNFQRQVPFKSFTVELSSGDRIRVDHPEALIVRGGGGVFVSKSGSVAILDHHGVTQVFLNDKARATT